MKRFKTKQEAKKLKDVHESLFNWTDRLGLWGLSSDNDPDYGHTNDVIFTKKPHPFDSMDIKVRVNPNQSKKLQKKAFKMGMSETDNVGWANTDRGLDIILYFFQGRESNWNAVTTTSYPDAIELTYKQFMNGTVPKKKEFKVGDWVEVVGNKNYEDLCFINPGRDGDIHEVTQISSRGNPRIGGYYVHPKNLKHTTKPKEQPLMFKGHEVEEVDVNMGDFKKFKIECKELLKNDLRQFMEVCTTASPDATPNEIYDFLQKHQSRLL